MDTINVLLKEILDIIGFNKDQDYFIERFMGNINSEILLDLMSTLQKSKQQELLTDLKNAGTDPNKLKELINSNFTDEHISKVTNKVVESNITEFLEEIDPELTAEQRQQIIALDTKLQSSLKK